MSLQLEPSHLLSFERPLTRLVKQNLRLDNTGSEPLIFKVKTTAPRLYCVRPNVGRIDPHSTVQVEVFLQAFKQEPPLDQPCKDKFLILSMAVDPSELTSDLPGLWARIESADKSRISQHKLRCEYRQSESKPLESQTLREDDQGEQAAAEMNASTITATEAPANGVLSAKNDDDKLAHAQQQLAEMQRKLDAYHSEITQLRKRNVSANNEPAAATTTFVKETRIESTGYPVYALVLVALVAFAIAWGIALSVSPLSLLSS